MKLEKPLVSIIIPTYNRRIFLAELLQSLVMQTFQDFEVVVVNDNGEIVADLMELYPELRLKVIDLDGNFGHVHARNVGTSVAQGEFILLCDDDDLLTKDHLQTMINEIKGHDLLFSDVEIVQYELEGNQRIPTGRRLFAYDWNIELMRQFSTFVPSGCLYQKTIHETIGEFDLEIHNYWDWDFFLRVAMEFKVKKVPQASVLYAFSSDGDNQSALLNGMRQSYLKKLCEKHQLGKLPTANFFTLLEQPEMKTREAESNIVWDGKGIRSRLFE